jgi:hypothetical protein
MATRDLGVMKQKLNSVGWFVPPYVSYALLVTVAADIERAQGNFTQDDLETVLSGIYNAERLASMVLHRYPCVPVVEQFSQTISESITAHFCGLGHVAIGGLIPVIEGAGRRLAKGIGIKAGGPIKDVFKSLAGHTKKDVVNRRIGAIDEIICMIESFLQFLEQYCYSQSHAYPLADRTNRHGITHGVYSDSDYGRPINFYKTIAAVDFLTFTSSLSCPTKSGFAPDRTPESKALAARYLSLRSLVGG